MTAGVAEPETGDSFLNAHRLEKGIYSIGAGLGVVSMRDQMIRASMLVNKAFAYRLIDPSKPLLVIGAGVGGVTAAIAAAQLDVPVVLIDQAQAPFSVQANCVTRFIDPVQYDWPSIHWERGAFPWAECRPMPLDFPSAYSSELAAGWDRALKEYEVTLGAHLRFHRGATITGPLVQDGNTDLLRVNLAIDGRPLTKVECAMILSCVGIGKERVACGDVRSSRFWENDSFVEPHLGLSTKSPIRVFVSGGGDGALQDYLRILTRFDSVKELYRSLIPKDLREMIEKRVQSQEDQAARMYVCSASGADHDWLAESHEQMSDLVKDLVASEEMVRDNIYRLFLERIFPRVDITMGFECSHFARSYALNRFLVLLIAYGFGNLDEPVTLRPGVALQGCP